MDQTAPQSPLSLPGDLTIYTAAEMKPRLLELLRQAEEPDLDLSAVTELDTAGLQLLLLAEREAERMGKRVRYLDPNPAVLEILRLCSLTARFRLDNPSPRTAP